MCNDLGSAIEAANAGGIRMKVAGNEAENPLCGIAG